MPNPKLKIMALYVTYFCWLLSEIMVNRLMHSGKTDKKDADKNSLRIIWLAIIVSISVAVYVSMTLNMPISSSPSFEYAGLVIIWAGIIARLLIIKSLGKYFTVDVTIRPDHQLKKDGPYKYLRHPSYFASLVSFAGFGISLNNIASLVIVMCAIIAAFIFRIKIEEQALIQQFGQQYLSYKKEVKALIPFVY